MKQSLNLEKQNETKIIKEQFEVSAESQALHRMMVLCYCHENK